MFENRETIERMPSIARPSYLDTDWRMVDLSLGARVARGVLYLDSLDPKALSTVDPGRLAIQDCEDCVLGQIYGDYQDSPAFLRGEQFLRAHGFLALNLVHEDSGEFDSTALNRVWRVAIRARMSAA